MRVHLAAAPLACWLAGVRADNLDTVMPHYTTTCTHGCQEWASQKASDDVWLSAKAKEAAGSLCAFPAKPDHKEHNAQPWCYCNPSPSEVAGPEADPEVGVCVAPRSVPEQINLQLAASDVVVVGFVTFEASPPKDPPVAMFGESAASMTQLTGVSHGYVTNWTNTHRKYTFSFVRFPGLKPRQQYSYKVKSGASGAAWSDVFTFRAPYGSGASSAAAAAAASDRLEAGKSLAAGRNLESPSGSAKLYLQGSDGNLVLRREPGGAALWSAKTEGNPGDRLQMQGDGNLVVYDKSSKALWDSNTTGSGAVRAVLQDDCGLMLFTAEGTSVWTTGTSCATPAPVPTPAPPATPPPTPQPPAPAPVGSETRIGIYGDMGRCAGNNMGNLRADCASGEIDAIVHMGDHGYNLQNNNEFLADGYMNVFSQVALASCPWIPIIGNHEKTAHVRYENQTWGLPYGQVTSTATSALGHLLTKGLLLGAGMHGAHPSGTSQWTSVDLGLMHIVGLDLNPPAANAGSEQLKWLEEDLAAADANRGNVPWILVTSHFPLHFSKPKVSEYAGDYKESSAAYWLGDEREVAEVGRKYAPCKEAGCRTVGDLQHAWAQALDPLLTKYAVDLYGAGHNHRYDTTWPLCEGKLCGEKSYTNPKGPVHFTEGNGGVPQDNRKQDMTGCPDDWARTCGSGYSYGRIIAHNATHLTYNHVQNPTGKITDTFTIAKSKPGRGW